MHQALIVVSFGTSVPSAVGNITAVENALSEQLPGVPVFRAFTSPTIRRILRQRGTPVPSLEERLILLRDWAETGGVCPDEVIVQPTTVLYGTEYDSIRRVTGAYRKCFSSVRLGRPLLSSQADLAEAADILSEKYPKRQGQAVVLFGHGSPAFGNITYPALQTVFALRGRTDILVGTVEGWPGLEDVRKELAGAGFSSVLLVPLVMVNGNHVLCDMLGDAETSWKNVLTNDGFTVRWRNEGLGTDPRFQEMYARRLSETLAEIPEKSPGES